MPKKTPKQHINIKISFLNGTSTVWHIDNAEIKPMHTYVVEYKCTPVTDIEHAFWIYYSNELKVHLSPPERIGMDLMPHTHEQLEYIINDIIETRIAGFKETLKWK